MSVSAIRYARLGYLALNVSDIEKSRAFYRDLVGLTDAEPASKGKVFLRCSERHHDLLLVEGAVPGVKRACWQMESDAAFDAAFEHFESVALAPRLLSAAGSEELHIGRAFRISEPTTGASFEFYTEIEAAPAPFVPTHTNIERLGHVVLSSVDRLKTEAFMREAMNFRVSDRIDGVVSFMRCFPNPYHHSFGVGQNERNGLNHVNFMVHDIDDIGRAFHRVNAHNVKIVYGPGRHPPSNSIFLYFLDPDGLTVEYSFGMEEFPEVDPREARLLPREPGSFDTWAAIPDPEFGKNGEIERELMEKLA